MVFSGGVPWNPPLCTNGSAGYLMQLSVNDMRVKKSRVLLLFTENRLIFQVFAKNPRNIRL